MRVEEVLKGKYSGDTLTVFGFLSVADDWSDHAPPYTFVRPEGRAGNCFAHTYRRGAQFLLALKLDGNEYTPYWYPLGPVNEQLRSAHDPWVQWVRERAKAK